MKSRISFRSSGYVLPLSAPAASFERLLPGGANRNSPSSPALPTASVVDGCDRVVALLLLHHLLMA
jgi:hypothetical protein